MPEAATIAGGPVHLCVLIHGLWGNPTHLGAIAEGLRNKYTEDQLHVFLAQSNRDTFTYDGIEVGAERVAREVEDELERLAAAGQSVTKLSVVGYSLGGLIARYCIGLLASRGWFDRLQPVNFTAFASPFLGVRAPMRGWRSSAWNLLGSRTLSSSGRQLFLIDRFRKTGRPLLSLLADPQSVFMQALARFPHRVLYANVINDRSAPWFTTSISANDPYEDIEAVEMSYLSDYAPIVCDPSAPVLPKPDPSLSYYERWRRSPWHTSSPMSGLPFTLLTTVLLPLSLPIALINAAFQTMRSNSRIQLHTSGSVSSSFAPYSQLPLMVDRAYESLQNHAAPRDHLTRQESQQHEQQQRRLQASRNKAMVDSKEEPCESPWPTLALAPEQFEMIENLDRLGFKKYPVHIHTIRHSHAAIIARRKGEAFKEGRTVIRHWLDEEFQL